MVIGRAHEQAILERLYESSEAEFAAVYGRRRVGKTYLIRETLANKECYFVYAVGVHSADRDQQLSKFMDALSETFFNNAPLMVPNNWEAAFKLLNAQIMNSQKKVVIFLDELPWMATPKSGLLETIEYYWNKYWQHNPKVLLVVCGSSASWIIKEFIDQTGGLHGRTTCRMKLDPFSLSETRQYLHSRNIHLNEKQITNLYMAVGGIPYYLRYAQPGLTAEQNIQALFFDQSAPLQDEFNLLFKSLFKNAEAYIELINLISEKRSGVSRAEIEAKTKLSSPGGVLSQRLKDLRLAGFIKEHIPWHKERGQYYKLIDEFCLFYLKWLGNHRDKIYLPQYWISQSEKSAYKSWAGYAFEAICMKHLDQICIAAKIPPGGTAYSWKFTASKKDESGVQIDLLVERSDGAITLFEIKYYQAPFKIDKDCAKKLMKKIEVFRKYVESVNGQEKQIFLVMIAANGLTKSMYSEEIVAYTVTLKDLFGDK